VRPSNELPLATASKVFQFLAVDGSLSSRGQFPVVPFFLFYSVYLDIVRIFFLNQINIKKKHFI
jgi:hypothetical protein